MKACEINIQVFLDMKIISPQIINKVIRCNYYKNVPFWKKFGICMKISLDFASTILNVNYPELSILARQIL